LNIKDDRQDHRPPASKTRTTSFCAMKQLCSRPSAPAGRWD